MFEARSRARIHGLSDAQDGDQARGEQLDCHQLPEFLPAGKIDGIGTVIIGTDESMVHLASVKGEKTECDASHAHATTQETSEVAATVVRSIAKNDIAIKPQLILYGASPLVQVTGRGTLLVERLDVPGERKQIDLDGMQTKGKFYDFAVANEALSPGGIYSAKYGSSQIVFQIDARARPGTTPIAGRLVRMD